MAKFFKWIGGYLGLVLGGPLGALAGFVFGALVDNLSSGDTSGDDYSGRPMGGENDYGRRQAYGAGQADRQRSTFLFSLLVLASYIIKADGKVMHSEMEFVRQWLRQNFGEQAVEEGQGILLKLFEKQKEIGPAEYQEAVMSSCRQMMTIMSYGERLQLLNFLAMIAQADGSVSTAELQALRQCARALGLSDDDVESMLHLKSGANDLDAAYKVLGVSPTASDDEVKAAYRRMALKNHPDKVAALGEDVRKAAEQKFQEINAAKETIWKARGM